MYDELTDQPAKANTSDLNEDLGQVEYLFSDKTGTLTENSMIFKMFSIEGKAYESRGGALTPVDSTEKPKNLDLFEKLFQVLTLCHTVQVDETMKEKYQASSPDEFSFVKFSSELGFEYLREKKNAEGRVMRTLRIVAEDCELSYELLDILEFDSDRRRMSVIVRELLDNRILLLCKGAESAIFKSCTSGDLSRCNADIKKFAEKGWRTLACAYRYMSEEEYVKVQGMINEAFSDIMNRKRRLADAYDEIESGLTLIGATAVEDKLQDQVAETLEFLREGGIKVWVLTGDKKETAVNISNSCRHFNTDMIRMDLAGLKDLVQIRKKVNFFENR
jgi:phospholipid-translocating ATPase